MSFVIEQRRLARLTMEELLALQKAITDAEKTRLPGAGNIYLYSPKARRKLDAIAWAITYKMKKKGLPS